MFREPLSFCIVNLGCKVNRVESDSIGAALLARGCLASSQEEADLIVVNTCTVTAEADKKARKAVRHALAANPLADVLVTGCAAAINADVFLAMGPRVRVVGKRQVEEELAVPGRETSALRVGEGFRTRVGLKVQDGCDHACTYCIVHVARGPAWSAPPDKVLSEARAYFQAGVREVVLTGIDIGAYRWQDKRLAWLARALVQQADEAASEGVVPARIRISSIEPLNVDDELVQLLSEMDGRVCRHLHLPLQSGSTKVLRQMDRPYDADRFLDLVRALRSHVPNIALSTDVIVGFPGEDEDDFKQTCDLVREAGFNRLHVFPYSRRAGTPAAERLDQVPPEVKRLRAQKLRDIGAQLAQADLMARAGSVELALVEGETALTESYHELRVEEPAQLGELAPFRIDVSGNKATLRRM